MPELPEVETIKRILEPQIKDRTIKKIRICNPSVIAHPKETEFAEELTDHKIVSMNRRGKFLIFSLENEAELILHLRMTGQLLVTPANYPEEKHTHLILDLDNENQIRYIDVRRFGRFWYIRKGEDRRITGIDKLGLEPFDEMLTEEYLREKLSNKKKAMKEILLDQSVIAGIGNIYGDEILYKAGIHPDSKCCELNDESWKKLADTIPKVLDYYIDVNQMSPEEYLAGKGKEYRNTPFLNVYGHVGKNCGICGSVFEKTIIGGRSSCYCPTCQKIIRKPLLTRQQLIDFGLTFPDTYLDAPFRDANWQLIRKRKSKKAFLWIYERNDRLCINVKVSPEWRDFWRSVYPSVQPGYHQNKNHWNTIILDGSVPDEDVRRMIGESYDLV